ncbi:hypothetical protein BEN71_14225 [Acinetobacter wuhouensis]|uniref:hypothetical protein n=1 Tax=Acinetobacter wuhouensis TaxID=1879050 RepID=UPI00083B8705|nr:hypothetical protein [Acinetobacter wuhouensis]AXQ23161.1 hypothetical protein BEN71_14225 [Acinetobacter wuhouensis]
MKLKNLNVSYIAGCLIDDDMFYVASTFDSLDSEIECSRMSFYDHLDGQWHDHDNFEFKSISVALVPKTESTRRTMLSVSLDGQIEFYSSQKITYEKIEDVGFSNPDFFYGTLNKIRNIQSSFYTCGSAGQIYKKAEKEWLHDDLGLLLPKVEYQKIKPEEILNLDYEEPSREIYDINGHNLNCLYACGEDQEGGFVACKTEGKWEINDKRTPSGLHHICLCPDGVNIIVVGDYGTVFYGNNESGFINLKDISINDSFYQSCYFKEDLYIAASTGLYKYSNSKYEILEIIPYGTEVSTVESTNNVLWVLTDKVIYRFNGKKWDVILNPDNTLEEDFLSSMKAGQKCPHTGYWFTVAKENSRQYFKQEDIFPDVKSDWGDVYWQFDGEE